MATYRATIIANDDVPASTLRLAIGDRMTHMGIEVTELASEDVNGWKNRETWQANLWLENDEGLYGMARDAVDASADAQQAADRLREIVEEHLYDPSEHNSEGLLGDVIGLWLDRVDWDALAAAYAE